MRKYFRICLFSFLSGWDCFISFPLLFSAFLVRLLPTAGLHLPMPFLEYYKLQCLEKARRYMNEMDIYPIYPKMNLSKRMQQAKVCPYLLRNAVIDKPNQARSIDITYIPIKRGFLYLTAVIDWHSRWADNIMIERWFRSFKYEEAYLTQYNNIKEARTAIGQYIRTYNFERHHSALDYQTPAECYYPAMLLPYVA